MGVSDLCHSRENRTAGDMSHGALASTTVEACPAAPARFGVDRRTNIAW